MQFEEKNRSTIIAATLSIESGFKQIQIQDKSIYIIAIAFYNRVFQMGLWHNEECIDLVEFNNGTKDLILNMEQMLNRHKLQLQQIAKLGFISGPGSFTSSRVVCAVCAGLQTVIDSLLIVPVRLDEAINEIQALSDGHRLYIAVPYNKDTTHFFNGTNWNILNNNELIQLEFKQYTAKEIMQQIPADYIPWPDVLTGVFRRAQQVNIQAEIAPFYTHS